MTKSTQVGQDQLLRHADRAMILAQRLTEWIAHAPDLEQDMALANLGLDLIGQARSLYSLAAKRESEGRNEDDFAYFRDPEEFTNPTLVEQPNGDFAVTLVRQFLHDCYATELWTALTNSHDTELREIAGKVVKETAYHLRYSRGWVVRLGDGTDQSHRRMIAAIDVMWPFVDGLFDEPESSLFRDAFDRRVAEALSDATLATPSTSPSIPSSEGPSAELVAMLAEMQELTRAHPGAQW